MLRLKLVHVSNEMPQVTKSQTAVCNYLQHEKAPETHDQILLKSLLGPAKLTSLDIYICIYNLFVAMLHITVVQYEKMWQTNTNYAGKK